MNVHVTPITLAKFHFNPTGGLGNDQVWRISRGHQGRHLGLWNGSSSTILNIHVAPVQGYKT